MDPTTALPALAFGGTGLLGVVIYLLRQNWNLTKENGQIRKEVNEQANARNALLESELDRMRDQLARMRDPGQYRYDELQRRKGQSDG